MPTDTCSAAKRGVWHNTGVMNTCQGDTLSSADHSAQQNIRLIPVYCYCSEIYIIHYSTEKDEND